MCFNINHKSLSFPVVLCLLYSMTKTLLDLLSTVLGEKMIILKHLL